MSGGRGAAQGGLLEAALIQMLADLQQFKCLTVNVAERLFGSESRNFLSLPALFDCGPSVASGMWDEGRYWKDGRQRKSLKHLLNF